MERVFIALGSNIGDRAANIKKAVDLIAASGAVTVVRSSHLYETRPWGVEDQPDFINAVIEVRTTLAPAALLAHLKGVEAQMGRVATERWGPRIIDADIIFYGARVVMEEGLSIPHARMRERAFVLVPLCECAPTLIHPVVGRTIKELLDALDPQERASVNKSAKDE